MNDEGFKLIGYSSDIDAMHDLASDAWYSQIARNSKNISKIRNKNDKLEKQIRAKETKDSDRESHVYLIRGEKRYYRVYRDLSEFKGYGIVRYLGIAQEPLNKPLKVSFDPNKHFIGRIGSSASFKEGMACCYCERILNIRTFSREHVIPKHKGGKIVMPCCKECNTEKGGLMLHSYIQMLNLSLLDFKSNTEAYLRLQTKIKNANRIAIEIEKKHETETNR